MEWIENILAAQGITLTEAAVAALKQAAPEHVVPKGQYNSKAAEAEKLQAQLGARDADIAALKKDAGTNEELKAQLRELQGKYKAETAELQTQLQRAQLDGAVDTALVSAGARNPKAVRALLDLSKVAIEGEGLRGLAEQLDALRTSDDYLFTATQPQPNPQMPYAYTPRAGSAPVTGQAKNLQEAIGLSLAEKLKGD